MLRIVEVAVLLAFSNYTIAYTFEELSEAKAKIFSINRIYLKYDDQIGCWPNRVIPYIIKDGFTENQVQHIFKHIYQLQNNSCLRFVEKDLVQTVRKYMEFVYVKQPNCDTTEYYTYNRSGSSKQTVTRIRLGDACFNPKSVLHEILHGLGFTHEHQRVDRDCYVKVDESYAKRDINFKVLYDSHYEKWPYDKRSILHYWRTGNLFQNILVDRDESWYETNPLGNYDGILTCLDAYKINFRYCNAPDFCEINPKLCQQIEEEEVEKGCKKIYLDVAFERKGK